MKTYSIERKHSSDQHASRQGKYFTSTREARKAMKIMVRQEADSCLPSVTSKLDDNYSIRFGQENHWTVGYWISEVKP